MNFKHTKDCSKFNMSSLQGIIDCTYSDLVKCFGLPTFTSDCGKTMAEWQILFEDGTPATIYDYKVGKQYCGDDGLCVDEVTCWHVGGHTAKAYDHVTTALRIKE